MPLRHPCAAVAHRPPLSSHSQTWGCRLKLLPGSFWVPGIGVQRKAGVWGLACESGADAMAQIRKTLRADADADKLSTQPPELEPLVCWGMEGHTKRRPRYQQAGLRTPTSDASPMTASPMLLHMTDALFPSRRCMAVACSQQLLMLLTWQQVALLVYDELSLAVAPA